MKPATKPSPLRDLVYDGMLERIRGRMRLFDNRPMFTTHQADLLMPLYLVNLPIEERSRCTCNTCRDFITRFGSLVVVESNGSLTSAAWDADDLCGYYGPAIKALKGRVEMGTITGVFMSPQSVLGKPETGDYHHFALDNPNRWTGPFERMVQRWRESFLTKEAWKTVRKKIELSRKAWKE